MAEPYYTWLFEFLNSPAYSISLRMKSDYAFASHIYNAESEDENDTISQLPKVFGNFQISIELNNDGSVRSFYNINSLITALFTNR